MKEIEGSAPSNGAELAAKFLADSVQQEVGDAAHRITENNTNPLEYTSAYRETLVDEFNMYMREWWAGEGSPEEAEKWKATINDEGFILIGLLRDQL